MSAPYLQTVDLWHEYAPGAPVLRGLTLEAPAGAMCALIGANGCGKSTLIRLLAGLLKPTGGEILVSGAPLRSLAPREVARRMAYVPQSTAMPFPFTALEVALTGRTPHTSRFQFENAHDRDIAMESLAVVGAEHLAKRPVTELSSGERQIVSVARALAQEPECLLLDEPSSSLDLKHRAALIRTLARLRETRQLTTIMVTHDLHLIDPVFDQVAALVRGQVAAVGTPVEVLTSETLARVYDDDHVRTCRVEGRTVVWSE